MKPIINDLNIYEDSKLRQRLAFTHAKEEIMIKDEIKIKRDSLGLKLTGMILDDDLLGK